MVGARVFRLAGALSSTLLLVACGGSSSSPPPQSPPSGSDGSVQISGRERFGWNETADDISVYHFAVYVDNNRVDLPAAVCHASAAGLFDCDSPLPPLTSGRHALEVVSWIMVDGQLIESPRSVPLIVNVTGISPSTNQVASVAPAPSKPSSPSSRSSNGCGLTLLSTHEFVMWDEGGTIRIIDQDSGASRPVAWKPTDSDQWVLSGVIVHPKFDENRWVYLVETPAVGDPALRLSRYREVGGVLGERAVLLQTRLDSRPARTALSFGPDQYLYIALLSSTTEPNQNRLGRDDRFLVRVSESGAPAPGDQTGSAFAKVAAHWPVALAWAPDSALPWVLTRLPDTGYSLNRLGDAQSVENRMDPASAPAAMQIIAIDNHQILHITGVQGDVRRLVRGGTGWTLRDGFRLFAPATQVRDALVLGDGQLAACGPVDGSRYGVWRVRLP